ncbi:sulfotransferase [[Mycobacterium] zoologicum]|uniref:sulfotransferase n=1 Tax=[Mycobacterium] zoologicum TaxID=2872311 RepID=UPI002C627176|nr:sulfotransferase [Mycolicibacter sp. MYC101]MEB3065660.1 sulfotransferase [Mycolicibacter sp. MYC101]
MNGNEDLITVLYGRVLKRVPSEGEFQEWVTALESGTSPATVVAAFYNSSEYQAKNSVKSAYRERDGSRLAEPDGSMRFPLFVVGSARSGTSALANVLWNIGYHGFGEGHFLTMLRGIDTLVDQHYVEFPQTGDMLWHIDKGDLKRSLFETFRPLTDAANPKQPWFDKTPSSDMIWAIPILRELWPSSVFVFAKRRGIENLVSRIKKFPDRPFEEQCADWAGSMAAWRNIRPQLPPECFIEVEQRDMIQQPDWIARRLCTFLHADESAVQAACKVLSTPGAEESDKGSASKTLSLAESGWTQEQTETFLEYCANEMEEFGYTMDEHYNVAS